LRRLYCPRAVEGGEVKRYMCVICGFMYDEAKGIPEDGIPPGTRWEDVPPNWSCPDCGARKEDFEEVVDA
jgi:rubredoxin